MVNDVATNTVSRKKRVRSVLAAAVFGGLMTSAAVAVFNGVMTTPVQAEDKPAMALATFAGGCFWCMEAPFDKLPGVQSTISGFAGGHKKNPTYKEVVAGGTGHTEVVQVTYDPSKVSYETLLSVFWRNIDPTVKNRQFCDVGTQYRSAIFFHSDEQKAAAESSFKDIQAQLKASGKGEVFTELSAFDAFYAAEDYHQDYYQKNPVRYKFYRYNCGRDQRLEALWGKDKG
jgi:peptide-methionine (S)-S-oxide reductase